ncbi:hypothetical protein ACFLXH_05695 [Chloroflexota bacterium]
MTQERDGFGEILSQVKVDRVGVIKLEDWKDAPVTDSAKELLPAAKSIIVLAVEVFSEVVKYLSSQRKVGEITLRDLYNRNTEMARGHLDWESYNLVKELHKLGYRGIPLPGGGGPYDSRFVEGLLSYKSAAHLAGLGNIGWNSMLLTPEYGARINLACVVTDAPLPVTTATEDYYPCPECGGACIKICPVSAIKKPESKGSYILDKYTCSTYLTGSGGCAECLRVCPAGKSNLI